MPSRPAQSVPVAVNGKAYLIILFQRVHLLAGLLHRGSRFCRAPDRSNNLPGSQRDSRCRRSLPARPAGTAAAGALQLLLGMARLALLMGLNIFVSSM